MITDDVKNLDLRFFKRNFLPIHRQSEPAECGLACLSMIAHYYGFQTNINYLRKNINISTRGMNLKDLSNAARSLDLSSRAVSLDFHDINKLKLPAILHWDFKHFVVLKKLSHNKMTIHDPAIGVRKLSIKIAECHFTGVAFEVWPNDQFTIKRENDNVSWKSIIGKPEGFLTFMLNMIFVGFMLEILNIGIPLATQWSIDNLSKSINKNTIFIISICLLIILLIQSFLEAARSWILEKSTLEFSLKWRIYIFERLLDLPIEWFQRRRIGDVKSRFDAANSLVRLLNNNFVENIIDGSMSIILIIIMLSYNIELTLFTTIGTFLYATLRYIRSNSIRNSYKERYVAGSRENSQFIESIRGIKTIKLLSKMENKRNEWLNFAVEEANSIAKISRQKIFYKSISLLIGGLDHVVIFYLSMSMVIDHKISMGAVVAFGAYRTSFYKRLCIIIDNLLDLKTADVLATRLGDIINNGCNKQNNNIILSNRVGYLAGSIECINVRFKYGIYENYILNNINLHIKQGESVAIVGRSGCGKSTLASMLTGLINPTEGEVLLGSVSINSLENNTIRAAISCVAQDDVIFSGTISQNISGFEDNFDIDFIIECAKKSCIHDEIVRMPMGYNSIITDSGGNISGGQRQRICIARALYRKPKIIILDEATSNLDIETEKHVNNSIKNLGITRIIFAHRLETIKSADRIVKLENGIIYSVDKEYFSEIKSSIQQ